MLSLTAINPSMIGIDNLLAHWTDELARLNARCAFCTDDPLLLGQLYKKMALIRSRAGSARVLRDKAQQCPHRIS